jgi:hypothetical protein
MDGKCNVHIDSHGLVVAPGQYDYNMAHGYWDLLADKVPGLFGSFGNSGQVGPMVRPMNVSMARNGRLLALPGTGKERRWMGPTAAQFR